MSVILFDQDEIFEIAAAVKALNADGSQLLTSALADTRAFAEARLSTEFSRRPHSADRIAEFVGERLIRACSVANRVAYERQYGERGREDLEEAGDADRLWPEFLEPVPLHDENPLHALHTRLRSLRYNLYTNAGRIFLEGKLEEALERLIDRLGQELAASGADPGAAAEGWW